MKHLWHHWTSINLVTRIALGMLTGLVLALVLPSLTGLTLLGTLFVTALKSVAPVLVLFLIISALMSQKIGTQTNMRTVLTLYAISTIAAGSAAVLMSFLLPTRLILQNSAEDIVAPGSLTEVLNNLLMNIVANPVTALSEANYIGILAWAILLGVTLKKAPEATKVTIQSLAEAVTQIVQFVIQLAPFGILGLVYEAVAVHGFSALGAYGRLLLVLIGTMLMVALVINPLIVAIASGRNPYPLVFLALRESGITAFFT
jgi:serine/threonine transporter